MTFQWITPPSVLARRMEDYGRRVLVAVQAAATYWGQMVQDQGRRGAPWQDRTGNARSGLFFAVDGFGLARDLVRGGFVVKADDERALEVAGLLKERLDLDQRLDDYVRMTARDGDSFLELGINGRMGD